MQNRPRKSFNLRKAIVFLLAMCLMMSQMTFVYAWQADNGNGTFNNPIMFADYPDPSMIRVGDYFYLATSTFVNSPGLVICRSEDMVNWEIVGHCMDVLTGSDSYNMTGTIKYAGGCFAPSIAYKDGTFYVVVNMNDGQRTRIYYAKDVAGPWKYNELGGSYFDPALFIDTDGTPYLAYGGAWQNQISMIQLNSNLSATTGSSKVILAYNNVEGSHLVKAKGRYYLFNAVPAQKLVCSRSNSVWGPYGETTTLCTAGKGGHQGGIVDLPDGSYWGYLHQDDGAIGRPTRICPITWQNDWPMFGREGHIGVVESTYTKPIPNKAIKVPRASDEFNGSSLGLQWMWNHNPDNTKWSLTGSSLRLNATTASSFWNARNSLTQKGQGLTSSGTIKIDCSKMQAGDIGGLGMLGDPRGYIAVTGNPRKIIMAEEDSVKATVNNITSNTLYFRIEMNFSNKQAKFFWKDDESKSWQSLGTTITMGFDWQNGTFQGEQYAIMNFSPSASTGYMDVDWFRLNDEPGPDAPPVNPVSAFTQIEAESYNGQSGIQNVTCDEGTDAVGYTENGDYTIYKNIDFDTGATEFQARVSSATSGGNIEIRLDGIDGTLIGTCPVAGTGDWQSFTDAKCAVSNVSGKHDLYLKFTGESGYLFNFNWFKFSRESVVKPGDVNADGQIDAIDLQLLKKYLLGSGTIENKQAADLDSNGDINAIDFSLLKKYLLGL
ncbi:MAG TPA: family 43 glycosylhydrolase [Ruminiclostridium sp.]|nr:family 43 glycosylhydrolase [Ruminiclostridium sp.]